MVQSMSPDTHLRDYYTIILMKCLLLTFNQARSQSAKRSTFSHKVCLNRVLIRGLRGGEVHKVHILSPKGPLFWGPARGALT